MNRFIVAEPLKESVPMVSTSMPPLPLMIVFDPRSATFTVLMVPVPASEPLVRVTVGVTAADVLRLSNLAPPVIAMPLLLLIEPVLSNFNVPKSPQLRRCRCSHSKPWSCRCQ